ncbi:HEAT repeat domain-containing protein [Gracilinema caldarium]|uniref:HEAT repeat domain-containing protein n=1 Tax=Gracilinema caldarium TaxID=215591 RepID=UPI0026E9728C|nr:HEAT repeat domain-containing protein [Gracilinema caldarium]
MKRNVGFIVLFLSTLSIHAQVVSPVLQSYQKLFIRTALSTKPEVVENAIKDPDMKASLGSFFDYTLNFVLQYADVLKDDSEMIRLASTIARAAASAGEAQNRDALWRLFMAYRDTETRVAVLDALAILGKGDSRVIENLNQFLSNQNNVFRSGLIPDYAVLSACITTLGKLGDGSSFPVLFSAMIAGYPDEYSRLAAQALGAIKGDYKKYLIDVIRKNTPVEKIAAFKAALQHKDFTPADRGEIAENTLDISLSYIAPNEADQNYLDEMRYAAVRELTEQKWSRATTLAIKHFYRVQTDYSNGKIEKDRYIEAIRCLGAMGTSEAAQALSLQLGLINSTMERTKDFDELILVSVIEALGSIGDKVAFDYLLYIGYLAYPDAVQTAAREAMNRLKW